MQTLFKSALFLTFVLGPGLGIQAQYQYPPGYYYPQPQQQYQYPYHPQQESSAQPRPAPRKPKSTPRDTSADKVPATNVSAVTGPFISYTWNFEDTLADLAKASGISPNQLLALNHLALSQLQDGQVFKLPELATSSSLDIKPSSEDQIAREVWRGVRGKKRVALTFDAGGDRDHCETLLKNLRENNVAATFFVAGEFAAKHGDLLQKIAEAGYPVHNHSWSHPDFTKISDDDIIAELSKADEAIEKLTTKTTRPYWRPPFGERDKRVLSLAAREGYKSIYWTIDSLDSVGDPKDAAFIIDRILNPPRAKAKPDAYLDGAIILMHVGKKGTAEAVPELVRKLRDRGFTLVTVDEILKP